MFEGTGQRVLVRSASAVLGCAISIGLYAAGTFGILESIRQSSGRSPESLLLVSFLLVAPVSLYIGSLAAGFLPAPGPKRSVPAAVLFSPGLWLCAAMSPVWAQRAPDMFVLAIIWVAVSWLGVLAGARLRSLRCRLPEGVCRTCGYDLTGNVSGRCPECGTPIERGGTPS